jgi:hypothetical protein
MSQPRDGSLDRHCSVSYEKAFMFVTQPCGRLSCMSQIAILLNAFRPPDSCIRCYPHVLSSSRHQVHLASFLSTLPPSAHRLRSYLLHARLSFLPALILPSVDYRPTATVAEPLSTRAYSLSLHHQRHLHLDRAPSKTYRMPKRRRYARRRSNSW